MKIANRIRVIIPAIKTQASIDSVPSLKEYWQGNWQLVGGLLVAFSLCLLPAAKAEAARFNFTKIADTSGLFSFFRGAPAIADNGTVVFRAGMYGGNDGLFTSNGGDPTTIADTSGLFSDFDSSFFPAIDNGGTVAFSANLDGGRSGIFTGNGGPIATIADSSNSLTNLAHPVLNNKGQVVFKANLDASEGLFTLQEGQLATIADSSGLFSSISGSAIDERGTVAFTAGLDAGGYGVFTSNGGQIAQIADTKGSFREFASTTINNNGTVAFWAGLNSADFGEGIFTVRDGQIAAIADSSGPYNSFRLAHPIDDSGNVAFWATLDNSSEGIFIGPDPVVHKVIAVDDPLFDSTVLSFVFGNNGLNNSGQIVFYAELTDGTSGIFRAEPVSESKKAASVPEPASVLGVLAVGAFALRFRRQHHKKMFF